MLGSYTHKYLKYKAKYLELLKQKGGHLISPKPYQREILSKYLKLPETNVLEIGPGNALRSILLASWFRSYVAVEPNGTAFAVAKQNCHEHNCNIEFIHSSIEDLAIDRKFQLVLFINSFHFVNAVRTMNTILSLLSSNGIIMIDEPKAIPARWADPVLNAASEEFDEAIWKHKELILNQTKDLILNVLTEKFHLNCDYYDLPARNVFVLQHK